MYRCVERAGFQVADLMLEPLASSYSGARGRRARGRLWYSLISGVVSTDVAIMQDSTIRHTAVVAIAGQKVTDDIRIGLSVLEDQAEKLKRDHGLCYADMIQEDEIITIPGIAGRPPKEIKKSVLAKIIQARVEEILEIVAIEIKRSGYASQLSAGAVITGGGIPAGGYVSAGQ